MERALWTDERLDDLSSRMDQGFEAVNRDLRDLRLDLGGQIAALRQVTARVGGGVIVGLVGVIAAIIARGA